MTIDVSTRDARTDELIELLGGLLDASDLDAECNFIEEGGDSILAVALDELVSARFGKKLDFQLLYRGTLGELGEALFCAD